MSEIRHILSISGGKDSAALAFHLRDTRPDIEFEYVFFDTGEELPETYEYLEKLERALGIKVEYIHPKKSFEKDNFSSTFFARFMRSLRASSEALIASMVCSILPVWATMSGQSILITPSE